MGVFQRIKTLFSANLNSMLDKAEDPEKMLNQLILEMNEQLVEAKKAVASAIADQKRLEKACDSEKDSAKNWENKAVLALKAGDESLAKEALIRKQENDTAVQQYGKQLADQTVSVDKLKNSLKDLQDKISEAQRKKNLLIARAKRAEAQKKIQATISSVSNNTSAFDAFDRMSQKVDQMEAQADAMQEVEELSQDADLDKKFKALEKDSDSVNLMLEQLKAKVLASPDSKE